MLRSLGRNSRQLAREPATLLAPCPACCSAAPTSFASFSTTSRPRPSTSRSTTATRAVASGSRQQARSIGTDAFERQVEANAEAAAEEEVEHHHSATTEQEEMEALFASFGDALATEPVALRSSPLATETTETFDDLELDSAPPPPPLPPVINASTLLSNHFPSGPPTSSDLDAFQPRHLVVPDAATPNSHRIIYDKSWEATFHRLDDAFRKNQLINLIGPKGLDLNLSDPRLRTATRGKKTKSWKPKTLAKMSKRELCTVIMVLQWGMVDPAVIPAAKKGPQVVEGVPLSDRTLFLLLSPNSTVVRTLTTQLGLKISFKRDPTTQVLSIVLRGTEQAVSEGRAEIDNILDTCHQLSFELPKEATTLRPEVFQAVSRMSKTFLEPGTEPNILIATALNSEDIQRTERLISSAFAHDAIRAATPVFTSLPASHRDTYAMIPFNPALRTPFTSGATPLFARVQTLSPTPDTTSSFSSSSSSSTFSPLSSTNITRPALDPLTEPTILGALRRAFASEEQNGDSSFELRAMYGHLVWPVYEANAPIVGENVVEVAGMGPVLDGEWGFEQFRLWKEKRGKSSKSVFLPSTPANFLPSTGVLTTTTPLFSSPSPFAALLSASDDLETSLANGPTFDTVEIRQRLVYRPVTLTEAGKASEKIEVDELSDGSVMRRRVWETKSGVMVPDGACDLEISLSRSVELHESAISDFTTSELPSSPPLRIELNSIPYLLDTHRSLRLSSITPFTTTSPLDTQHQEHWRDLQSPEANRGVGVSIVLGRGTIQELKESGVWKEGLERAEEGARERSESVARREGGSKVY